MTLDLDATRAFCEAEFGISLESAPLLDLGSTRWRPTLGNEGESLAIYLCDSSDIGASIRKRLVAATARGYRVLVVIPDHPTVLGGDSLEFLLGTDVEIVLVLDNVPARYRDFAVATWEVGLYLPERLACDSVIGHLRESLIVPASEKGGSLEHALALTASQVPAWRVRNIQMSTSNEELDVVVANSSAQSPWNGSAFILVEAKNWNSNVDRVEYDAFHMKVKERGGACRLGLFVAAVGFSAGFYERAAHHGSDGFSIIPMSVPWMISRLESGLSVESLLAERVEQVVLDRQWEETQGS